MSGPTPFAFPLEEVAELTGLTVRQLRDGCRAKEIPHTLYRSTRVMTPEHIAQFLAAHEVRPEQQPAEQDAEQVEAWKRRIAARVERKAGRAAA